MRRTICSLTSTSAALLALAVPSTGTAATGGPDLFGYTFVDQDDGAVYNYVDITTTGVLVQAEANNVSAMVPLSASFEIYGAVVMDMIATTNGILTDDPMAANDVSNDCPIPDPPSTGGGFRIYPLHDDLNTAIYAQYFNEMQAAAVGYPGETAGITVIQWVGYHGLGDPMVDQVDFEVVLFHDDFTILTMVNLDSEGGNGSTLGIQNPAATIGLNYQCNTAMSVIPGVTAVEFSLAVPPDSDCCSDSPTGTPGCTYTPCQDVVCGFDAFCCETDWDAMCAADAQAQCPVLCGTPPPVTINEIRIDQAGLDDDEYIELAGPPGTALNDLQYIVLGDTPTGEIEAVIDLTGQSIGPSGLFVIAEGSFTLGIADFTTFINFENADTVTHMLVGGFNASVSDNLDLDADGVLDSTPWLALLDAVSVLEPMGEELPYAPGGACVAGPTCQDVGDGISTPGHVFRCPDADGTWLIGNIDELAPDASDTPGAPNDCVGCGNGVVDPGEDCDDAGESAACDDDCTAALCGDGTLNMTAGETCDDAGESPTCNGDCTPAMCGDGVVNMTAGEGCDDMGESEMCNADCTPAMCGDGQVNMTAGETCDDTNESANCDDDCTEAECGDGVLNVTAGEACDDGGRSETCNDDCSIATCGDGVVNAAAGEDCDDMEETETCDDDCTEVMCGDSVLNALAGEECDDGGESETCDDDCTPAECGDGVVNATAGEDCDDGNTDDGDGCAADCTTESSVDSTGGSSGGADDDTGDSGVADTTGDGDDSGSTGPGEVPGDEGCSCSAPAPDRDNRWSLLALLGLGALRRRR